MRVLVVGTRVLAMETVDVVKAEGHEVFVVTDHEPTAEALADDLVLVGYGEMLPGRLDLLLSVHNFQFVPEEVRSVCRHGALGYHPSLLPRWRGNDAVRWTIEAGDPIAGGTWYWLDDGMDTGPIAYQDWCHVDPNWDARDLWVEALMPMGLKLLRTALGDLERGIVQKREQDERFANVPPGGGAE